jgi:CDP-diglyceride synthetase
MSAMKNIKWKHYINYIVIAAATILFTVLSFSGALKSSNVYLLEKIAISITLTVSLSMVVGFLGELSLGHAGFMCIGAYLGGKASVLLEPVLGEFPALVLSLLIGGILAAVFGGIIGAVAGLLIFFLVLQFFFGYTVNYWFVLLYAIVGSLGGVFGDLCFSVIKRQTGIKDYGNLIPGHGGVLDRFDSMMVVGPLVEVLLLLLPVAVK